MTTATITCPKSGINFETAILLDEESARTMLDDVKNLGEGYFEDRYSYSRTVCHLTNAIDIWDRTNKKPKFYDIYYIIKANGHQYVHCMSAVAGNVKDVKTIVRAVVFHQTGRNAFSMTNGKLPDSIAWEYVTERDGVTEDEIKQRAKKDGYLAI